MKKWTILIIVLVVILGIVGWFFKAYNAFVKVDQEVATQWAQVENQYQRRYDLIPNLVETVKGVSEQEQSVFLGVAEARSKVGQMNLTADDLNNPETFAAFESAQDELSGALSRLLVAVEAYPDLKSSTNFLSLQDQLEGTENRIAVERGRFNETVQTYNIRAKAIPGVWLVGIFGFDAEKQLFEAVSGAESAPKVEFNLNGEGEAEGEVEGEVETSTGDETSTEDETSTVTAEGTPAMGAVD